ncbi:MAG: hypothetical protein N2C14_33135 [Planctomycetales bacterium]
MRTSNDEADRPSRLARVKQEIASGRYETPEKLEAAVEAMLDAWEIQPTDESND